jgi:hypothetical protein
MLCCLLLSKPKPNHTPFQPCRSQGLDHFIWLTGDRGACDWPAEPEPHLANIIKVVHFGWHHSGAKAGVPKGWEGHIKNKVGGAELAQHSMAHWHCQH